MSPRKAAANSSGARRAISRIPAPASVPLVRSSDSPGRKGATTSPVSAKIVAKTAAYAHAPICSTSWAR